MEGNPSVITQIETQNGAPIAVDSEFVYFALADGIYRAPIAGGPYALVAPITENLTTIAVAGSALYWAEFNTAKDGKILKLAVF